MVKWRLIICQVVLFLAITKLGNTIPSKGFRYPHMKMQTTSIQYGSRTLRNLSSPKKWQWKLGKIQKRQYNILNTIWRKGRVYNTTTKASFENRNGKLLGIHAMPYVYRHKIDSSRFPNPVGTTESLIEFNYFDKNFDDIKFKHHSEKNKYNGASTFPPYTEIKSHVKELSPSLKLPRSIERINMSKLPSPLAVLDKPKKHKMFNVSIDNSQGLLKASGNFYPYKFNYQISVRPLKPSSKAKNIKYSSKLETGLPKHYNNTYGSIESKQRNAEDIAIKENYEMYVQSKSETNLTQNSLTNIDVWDDVSFIAAYVYEPSHVYCDAAILSEHWLVTAGSCLYRHHKEVFDTVSPHVTYCDKNWREAEQINYVKYSVVHPNYHPANITRKILYNIGLIQVVNALSASCRSWSTVTLMPRHFTTGVDGSPACAVGWGLDKYDNQNISVAPSYLGIYNGIIYSHKCPGNQEYMKFISPLREGSTKPVICLSLPPYRGEQSDPIHGSLLLVDQMLVGLYLQEERRPSGAQSAMYTSVWGLSPWVMNLARETDET